MSTNKNFGGIEFKHVITFQTQIMMGAQFGRVKNAQKPEDIIVACLRMGWNDAFRHTSENKKADNGKTVLELKSAEWNKEHKEKYDDYICSLLGNKIVLKIFKEYAKAKTTEEKVNIVTNQFGNLKDIFEEVKKTDGERQLCFGHFQKMFNIAIKLYLCLYMCREFLGIDSLFCEKIVENFENADCPIDSIILDNLKEKTSKNEYGNYKWSKFGTGKYPKEYYINVQEDISKLINGKSNLYYDFIAWE